MKNINKLIIITAAALTLNLSSQSLTLNQEIDIKMKVEIKSLKRSLAMSDDTPKTAKARNNYLKLSGALGEQNPRTIEAKRIFTQYADERTKQRDTIQQRIHALKGKNGRSILANEIARERTINENIADQKLLKAFDPNLAKLRINYLKAVFNQKHSAIAQKTGLSRSKNSALAALDLQFKRIDEINSMAKSKSKVAQLKKSTTTIQKLIKLLNDNKIHLNDFSSGLSDLEYAYKNGKEGIDFYNVSDKPLSELSTTRRYVSTSHGKKTSSPARYKFTKKITNGSITAANGHLQVAKFLDAKSSEHNTDVAIRIAKADAKLKIEQDKKREANDAEFRFINNELKALASKTDYSDIVTKLNDSSVKKTGSKLAWTMKTFELDRKHAIEKINRANNYYKLIVSDEDNLQLVDPRFSGRIVKKQKLQQRLNHYANLLGKDNKTFASILGDNNNSNVASKDSKNVKDSDI